LTAPSPSSSRRLLPPTSGSSTSNERVFYLQRAGLLPPTSGSSTSKSGSSTSNERVFYLQGAVPSTSKGGSAGHLSSGEKGHFRKAGIRLCWIGDDLGLDFWGFFGFHFEHNLAWTCRPLKVKVCATWIDDVTTKVVENDISKSVLSSAHSPHVNIFYCMGGLEGFRADFFSPRALRQVFPGIWLAFNDHG
jgi:hypothetical protein